MSHWLRPLCCSRTGASHRRKAIVCQDASGWHAFHDRHGELVQVMAVADGHGGARYGRSDVGSWLACRAALIAARQLFQSPAPRTARPWRPGSMPAGSSPPGPAAAELAWPLGRQEQPFQEQPFQEQPWLELPYQEPRELAPQGLEQPGLQQQWLGREFPRAIQRRWLQAVHRHWRRQRPAENGEGFSPLLYGTTLGLVVMTPRWWGHTGLGDWDLLQLQAGGAQLLSQESDPAAAGEATFSLCLDNAAAHFAPRTAIQILDPSTEPFALVLSTDGIRKSCSTDDDFLALGRYLSQAPLTLNGEGAIDLAASLDHISSQGSGDDVTVAIAHWLPEDDKRRQLELSSGLAPAGPQLQPQRPRSLEGSRSVQAVDPVHGAPVTHRTETVPTPGAAAVAAAASAAPRPAPKGQPRPEPGRRPPITLAWLLAAVLIGGLGTVALTQFRLGGLGLLRLGGLGRSGPAQVQAVPVPMEAQQLEAVRQQVRQLCAEEAAIRPLLEERRPSFRAVRWGWRQRQELLTTRDRDPLETLVALSYDPTSGSVSRAPEFVGLGICPPLQQALTQLWLESQGSGLAAH